MRWWSILLALSNFFSVLVYPFLAPVSRRKPIPSRYHLTLLEVMVTTSLLVGFTLASSLLWITMVRRQSLVAATEAVENVFQRAQLVSELLRTSVVVHLAKGPVVGSWVLTFDTPCLPGGLPPELTRPLPLSDVDQIRIWVEEASGEKALSEISSSAWLWTDVKGAGGLLVEFKGPSTTQTLRLSGWRVQLEGFTYVE